MSFERDFDGLLDKFAELLVGDSSPESVSRVTRWALYSHINKTMPNLTAHWSQTHPESKAEVRKLFEEIRELNKQLRAGSNTTKPED